METVANIILSTGNHQAITQETYEQISMASGDDFIQLPNGSSFKKSAVMEILGNEDYYEKYPEKKPKATLNQGGQIYTWEEIKQLPGLGYNSIAKLADSLVKLERFVKGLKIAKTNYEKQGIKTPHIDQYIQEARISYANLKAGRPNKKEKTYNPKYKKWEEAKLAGVV